MNCVEPWNTEHKGILAHTLGKSPWAQDVAASTKDRRALALPSQLFLFSCSISVSSSLSVDLHTDSLCARVWSCTQSLSARPLQKVTSRHSTFDRILSLATISARQGTLNSMSPASCWAQRDIPVMHTAMHTSCQFRSWIWGFLHFAARWSLISVSAYLVARSSYSGIHDLSNLKRVVR